MGIGEGSRPVDGEAVHSAICAVPISIADLPGVCHVFRLADTLAKKLFPPYLSDTERR